ncbi:copper chaperone CopZ [Ectobacillus antri]|jgi:copper chaperone|uniref:Copper chaperone CopZ n=1 Tax=Ectobacillus antri TaxID=2486280 RepID=A0ABT6H5V8_9BACI|nr:copper chaperone CopZ [Ectobacillus antri]MDG4657508.1 copper chaperone CopZ [Ectobacillus antri]MDG5753821.1 copper chaperone CopZ [Ectobacillus antri]
MKQLTLTVQGMSCGHCVNAIEGSVGKLNGVENVTVVLREGKVNVSYDEAVIDVSTIKQMIEDQGYDVV